ncbi:MAG: hypothetical protein KBF50_14225, partial [Steroidobacteraceae bacterium]|nr:hypothetical protein [Steroidobacteraceae bacterium]
MNKRTRLLTLCAAFLMPAICATTLAATPTVEERLQALETGYAELKAENARLRGLLAGKAPPATPGVPAAPAVP